MEVKRIRHEHIVRFNTLDFSINEISVMTQANGEWGRDFNKQLTKAKAQLIGHNNRLTKFEDRITRCETLLIR